MEQEQLRSFIERLKAIGEVALPMWAFHFPHLYRTSYMYILPLERWYTIAYPGVGASYVTSWQLCINVSNWSGNNTISGTSLHLHISASG